MVVYPGTVIGNNVILHAGCIIGGDGFGNAPREDGSWEKIEHLGNVVIGNDVEIGCNTTVDRAQMESTVIGNGVRIDNLCIFAGQVGIAGHVKIADHTTICAQGGVIGHIRKEGQVLVGSPVMDAKQYMKAYALFKRAAEE